MKIYSRNSEDNTPKYPDVAALFPGALIQIGGFRLEFMLKGQSVAYAPMAPMAPAPAPRRPPAPTPPCSPSTAAASTLSTYAQAAPHARHALRPHTQRRALNCARDNAIACAPHPQLHDYKPVRAWTVRASTRFAAPATQMAPAPGDTPTTPLRYHALLADQRTVHTWTSDVLQIEHGRRRSVRSSPLAAAACPSPRPLSFARAVLHGLTAAGSRTWPTAVGRVGARTAGAA